MMATSRQIQWGNIGDLIGLCAAGEAVFQRAAHQGLGRPWVHGGGVAGATVGASHQLLLACVTLEPRPRIPRVLARRHPRRYRTAVRGVILAGTSAWVEFDRAPEAPPMSDPPGSSPTVVRSQ